MTVTVERTTEPQFPGEWTVMEDGVCYSRHDTETQAEEAAVELRRVLSKENRVTELMDCVQDRIMTEFELSNYDALQAMREYIEVVG